MALDKPPNTTSIATRIVLFWGLVPVVPFLAVMVAPSTRWLVLKQYTAMTRPPSELGAMLFDLGLQHDLAKKGDSVAESRRAKEVAERSPEDYEIQLAHALLSGSVLPGDLLRLAGRFPDRAGLYAHFLRYQTQSSVSLRFRERTRSTLPARASIKLPPARKPDSQALAQFEQASDRGAKLDPQNAFFPFIRSVGLFAAGKDAEAVASIKFAATKPRWDDYAAEEMRAKLKLYDGMWGANSVLNRIAFPASTLFPHFSRLRAVTRLAVSKAAEAERMGQHHEGLEIRKSISRIATLMRAESTTSIGSLVAIALTRIAAMQPGGADRVERPAAFPADRWAKQQFGLYRKYLEAKGFSAESHWAQSEYDAGEAAKEIIRRGLDRSVIGGSGLSGLVRLWVGGMSLLANALWLWLLGCIIVLLARIGASPRSIVLVALIGFVLIIPLVLSLSVWSEALAALLAVMANLTNGATTGAVMPPGLARIATIVLALTVPVITVLAILVAAAMRDRFDTRKLALITMPVAFALFICYGAMTAATALREARLDAQLDAIVRHEGRAFASLLGRPWPDRVK